MFMYCLHAQKVPISIYRVLHMHRALTLLFPTDMCLHLHTHTHILHRSLSARCRQALKVTGTEIGTHTTILVAGTHL